jgi:hypothetical protein
LLLGAASCALLIHNLTSMNRITRLWRLLWISLEWFLCQWQDLSTKWISRNQRNIEACAIANSARRQHSFELRLLEFTKDHTTNRLACYWRKQESHFLDDDELLLYHFVKRRTYFQSN